MCTERIELRRHPKLRVHRGGKRRQGTPQGKRCQIRVPHRHHHRSTQLCRSGRELSAKIEQGFLFRLHHHSVVLDPLRPSLGEQCGLESGPARKLRSHCQQIGHGTDAIDGVRRIHAQADVAGGGQLRDCPGHLGPGLHAKPPLARCTQFATRHGHTCLPRGLTRCRWENHGARQIRFLQRKLHGQP